MKKNRDDVQLSNPLLYIAQGISGQEATDEIWEEEPVGPVEFVESKHFFILSSHPQGTNIM